VCQAATEPVAREALSPAAECVAVVVGSPEWDVLLRDGREADAPAAAPGGDDLAVLLFTAGTSGRPKGAMLTHAALRADIDMLLALDDPPPAVPEDVVLVVLPLFHIYGLNAVLGPAAAVGATCVLVDRFDPRESLDLVREHGVTLVAGAPPMYQAWLRVPDGMDVLRGVRLLTSGGAPLPAAVFDAVAERTGGPVWEGYGLTETAPVIATTLASHRAKAGSVGRPLPGLEVRLVEAGADVDDGDPGELWVRGASVFAGYWPDGAGGPDADGWFNTGDVAYADADGDLHLVDRRREVILVSGFNVYPREVELVIDAIPEVAECAVVGIPHDYTGEAVRAFVVLHSGAVLSSEAVLAHCARQLARFKCPTSVVVVDELPHSATGKVAKGRLREVHGE
jgi:long-chain acyl-CoA synthetase